MNNVRTSFLSLLADAYNPIVKSFYKWPSMRLEAVDQDKFQAPFLHLKSIADAQARQITALEGQLHFLQAMVDRLDTKHVSEAQANDYTTQNRLDRYIRWQRMRK